MNEGKGLLTLRSFYMVKRQQRKDDVTEGDRELRQVPDEPSSRSVAAETVWDSFPGRNNRHRDP